MEEQRTNGNSRKNRYKWILATTAITVMAGSNIYFFTKYNEQLKLIENQAHYINELKTTITQNNNGYQDSYVHFDKLFNNTWLSFKHRLSDIEDIITNSWNNGIVHHNQNSSYRYLSINSTDKEYIINIALPGFSKEEVSLELSDNMLIVSRKNVNHNTSKDDDNTDTGDNNPEPVSKAVQSVRIPGDIDRDNINATLNNGLLTVILQKANVNNPKEIKTIPVN